jgi:hypothetical protein
VYKRQLNVPSAIFKAGGGYPDLILGPNPSATQTRAIYPSVDNAGILGWSTRRFSSVYAVTFHGTLNAPTSDKRLKENFRPIENPLDKILRLNGQKYDFINKGNESFKNEKEKKRDNRIHMNRLVFISQDVEKIIPEAVFHFEDDDCYYLDYNAIIPVIVEAMKEQQEQIETLQNEITNCCQAKTKSASIIGVDDGFSKIQTAKLFQNTPNPFSNETTIRFEIPENVLNAQLHICNMTGTLLKTINIHKTGNGRENIQANEFNAGMYLYSLVCDGKIVDTKQMMLTE